jgi:phosphoglycolate phosphatase-like HAD superfamily hydrolase
MPRGIGRRSLFGAALLAGTAGLLPRETSAQADTLPSWRGGAAKMAIIDFVKRVTSDGSADFVPAPARIAVFDNDGTLWCEQPVYFQMAFAFDQVGAMAPQHPEWQTTQPFKAVLEHDLAALGATGERGLGEIMAVTHAGMTTDAFAKSVADWIAAARQPRFNRPYTDLVYRPMIELLAYLRATGFKTFIVSGGGVEFMRPWTEKIYGVPPEQVVGSSGVTKFEMGANGQPVLVDDGAGKPVGINRFIGRRPILAFGNSDGDQQMLEWTAAGDGARLMAIVHHTDAEREYAYDRQSQVGKLDKAWDEGVKRGWTIVDMKTDWAAVFPFQRQ